MEKVDKMEKLEFSTGDYVYCEVSSEKPFQIFCIERIKKHNRGLDMTIRRLYRKIEIKDCQTRDDDDMPVNDSVKFRELLVAESTRSCNSLKVVGKCRVDLLLGFEDLASYVEKEDYFFYSHYYDPRRQSSTPVKKIPDICPIELRDDMQAQELETLVEPDELMWDPTNPLSDEEMDCFVDVVRRYNNTNSHKFNRMDASSRAHNILNSCKYSMFDSLFKLMNDGETTPKDDQIWSEEDTKIFESALRSCRKNFHLMQRKFPDKTVSALVDFYFKWKSSKLGGEWTIPEKEQVVTLQLINPVTICEGTVNCEICSVSTSGWQYASAGKSIKIKVCQACWVSWKKYGQTGGSLSPDVNDLKDANVEVDDEIDEVQKSEEDEDYEPPMKKVRTKVEQ